MIRELLRHTFVVGLGSIALTSCSDSSSPTAHATPIVISGLSGDSLFFGRKVQLSASAPTDTSLALFAPPAWSSSDTTVAVVDTTGLVLAVGVGHATISADFHGGHQSATLRVVLQRTDGSVGFVDGSFQESAECALTASAAVYCRGTQSSVDSLETFRLMPGSPTHQFTSIHTALDSQCGLATDGIIYCWGRSDHWIWATNAHGARADSAPVAVKQGNLRFSAMGAGGHSSICGIGAADGVLYCWGHNDLYQLGRVTLPNQFNSTDDSTIAPVANNLQARTVSVANQYACALDMSGAAWCWGTFSGQMLGVDAAAPSPIKTPQPVVGGLTFTSIYANWATTCALTVAGEAYCWGDNTKGQLGIGTNTPPAALGPQKVMGDLHFTSVAGSLETGFCGITVSGDVYCWGEFSPKSVSDRLGAQSYVPHKLAIGAPVRALSRVLDKSMCVIATDGRALCW